MSTSEQPPLAGWHGNFYLRDAGDVFRLYPRGRIHLDSHSFFGSGVNDVTAADGGNALQPRFFARRVRMELAGEFMKRWSFIVGVDFGGQSLSNANGKTETAAASAGSDPTAESARWASVQTASSAAVLANNWINYRALPMLNFMFGQYQAPYSLENMTSNNETLFMERFLPIRSFVVPGSKDIGAMVWGDFPNKIVVYHLGVFAGEGANRPGIDATPAVIGRIYTRPFAGTKDGLLEKAQIGVSGMHTKADQAYVGFDYPRLSTGQGYTLWEPRYRDSQGRNVHIIPSGSQNAIGGELWLPIKMVDLRAEAHYVSNNTREAVAGYQLTNTERLGTLSGIGWYAALSVWIGDTQVSGEPGFSPRPTHVDFKKEIKHKKGLQLVGMVGGVQASYDGAARAGTYDEGTPGGPGGAATDINVLQYGAAANYWYTKHVRLTVNYSAYATPGSGTPENLAEVPGNTVDEPDPDAHVIHELGTRIGIAF